MVRHTHKQAKMRKAGYAELIRRYGLEVIPNWHKSLVATNGIRRITQKAGTVEEVYPSKYWPGDGLVDHLEFALKYDGTNLGILATLFQKTGEKELVDSIRAKPTGKYVRRLWFLYEFVTGRRLDVEDLDRGNYVDLLDPERYYTLTQGRRVRRQRINDNMLGDRRFCPTVRRTNALAQSQQSDLTDRCRKILAQYEPELVQRTVSYLYTKETKSSFDIEHIRPDSRRTERFVSLLRLAATEDFCEKDRLVDLQNRIVDPRFGESDFRTTQNYVGETVSWQNEKVHFVGPKPEDLADLMEGLVATHLHMKEGEVPAVVHAAVVAYGFVFLHPFEDGNGRIHRFLIHNILARRGLSPEGIMFPISAVMARRRADYDASLEAFSRPLMQLVEYELDEAGRMTVSNETAHFYRYMDMTPQAEALFGFIRETIDRELAEELAFLANYDQTKNAIQQVVDMPDRKIDLFIRFCLQNNGRLSARKQASHFAFLSDDEVAKMEQAVRTGYGPDGSGQRTGRAGSGRRSAESEARTGMQKAQSGKLAAGRDAGSGK